MSEIELGSKHKEYLDENGWKDEYPPYVTSQKGKIEFLWEKVGWHRDESAGLRETVSQLQELIRTHEGDMVSLRNAAEERLLLADDIVGQMEKELRQKRNEAAIWRRDRQSYQLEIKRLYHQYEPTALDEPERRLMLGMGSSE